MFSARSKTVLHILYLAHLLVPLCLAADCVRLWHQGHLSRGGIILLAGASSWIAIALAVFLWRRNSGAFLQHIVNPLITFYVISASLIGTEFALRVLFAHKELHLRPPGKRYIFHIVDKNVPGLTPGDKVFSVNNVGLRGPDFPEPKDRSYKIVTLGGSTTECGWLDDSEDWTHLLMTELNSLPNGHRVWVANAGSSGTSAIVHLRVLQNLPIFRRVQMVIMMFGGNDLAATLMREGGPTNSDIESYATTFIEGLAPRPYARGTLLARSEIYRIASHAFQKNKAAFQPDALLNYRLRLRDRAQGKVVPLPDLRIGVAEYHGRIVALDRECHSLGLRCLFLTQPNKWRENLSAEEQKHMSAAAVGPPDARKVFGSYADLSRAMKTYNQTLMDTCRQHVMECYDLASFVPQDSSALYDDLHFNEPGARLTAHLLSVYLQAHSWATQSASGADGLVR